MWSCTWPFCCQSVCFICLRTSIFLISSLPNAIFPGTVIS
uniref:Uncharacterized protein n=1 Tax=Anguilla anguilla TaxID=7936 RepID=A0A0E9VR05_ANGAN